MINETIAAKKAEQTSPIQNDNGLEKKPKTALTRNKKRLIFYSLCLIFPLLHFLIFYVYVNVSIFTLAFQVYEKGPGGIGYVAHFAGFQNFIDIIKLFSTPKKIEMILTSLEFYIQGVLCMPLTWFFAYYIYKRAPLSNFFRVMLFLPSILSVVVTCFLYRYMVLEVFKTSLSKPMIMIYNVWAGFGTGVVMYTGAMCGIDNSLSEAAQLDGANAWQEFFKITLPLCFPTMTTFMVMGVAGIFSNQNNLYTFYYETAPIQSVGYYLFLQAKISNLMLPDNSILSEVAYPQLCAMSIMIMAILLPLALLLRKCMEKFGPSAD